MGKNLKFSDLEAEKIRINARAAQLEQGFITSFLHPERIVLGTAGRVLRRIGISDRLLSFLPTSTDKSSIINTFLHNTIRKSSGVMSLIGKGLTLINNPIISAFLVKSRKAWFKWQAVNVGFIVASYVINSFLVKKTK